jgi:hypothetical protein
MWPQSAALREVYVPTKCKLWTGLGAFLARKVATGTGFLLVLCFLLEIPARMENAIVTQMNCTSNAK